MKKILTVAVFVGIFRVVEGYQLIGIEGYDENGKTRVVITSTEVPQYRAFVILNPARLIVDILNAEDSLSKDKIKNTSDAILSISSQQRLKEPVKIVRVTVGLKALFPYQLLSDKNSVIIEMDTAVSKKGEIKIKEYEEPLKMPEPGILPPLGKLEEAIKLEEEKKEKKKEEALISMKCYEMDILDVLKLLSKKIRKDIVTGPNVSAIITIELNNVRWDQALDMILKPNNFAWVSEEGIIRVDIRENLLKTAIKTEVVSINYDTAENMAKIVEPLLDPDAGGKIIVDKRTNSLIITTTSKNLDEINCVVKSLDAPTPQVMIEAKMVQVNYNEVQGLGINWGFTHPSSTQDKTEGIVTLPTGPARLSIGRLLGNTNVFLTLDNLITQQKAEIVASPKIATSDNQIAKIKVGGQLPYGEKVAATGQGGEAGTTIKFIDVSIELEITPKVNPNKTISLDLNVINKGGQLKDITIGGDITSAPFTQEKSAKTKILVNDGETLIIGGMISKDEQVTEMKVPILCDLPFIGKAFRHKRIGTAEGDTIKKELLIFITPHILK